MISSFKIFCHPTLEHIGAFPVNSSIVNRIYASVERMT
jgi:hypothetical protein